MDADTGEIVATTLTSYYVDDGSKVGPLLDQVNGPVVSVTRDGAFDGEDVYALNGMLEFGRPGYVRIAVTRPQQGSNGG